MAHPIIRGDQVWCPCCKQYVDLLRIRRAAKIADVSCKTIYRYVEEGKVYIVKIAGSTIRICSACRLKQNDEISG
jgi:hypothetical protein